MFAKPKTHRLAADYVAGGWRAHLFAPERPFLAE
jgi:hypothetical protein